MCIIIYVIVVMIVILIIVGQAGDNEYSNKGGGSNYLCLPNDPDNGKPYSNGHNALFGAEYEVSGSSKPSGFGDNLQENDVTCALCRRRGKSSVLMIPGKRFIFLIYFQYQTFYFTYQAKLMKYLSDIPNKTTTRNSYIINMMILKVCY